MYILRNLVNGNKMQTFSSLSRNHFLDKLEATEYDLLIIGGGITGAGIALDAASRGLKVALVEKQDYACGTSSRSTKLIHGGLRYLKQLEFGLVKEVGLERAVVYENAKHIVRPERMLLPIVKNGSLGKTMSSLGLWVYDFLAGVKKSERRKMLNKEKTVAAEPLLRSDILKGGGLYYEYRSDDARLTIENIKTAYGLGANCLNYVEAVDYILDDYGKICGARLKDLVKGRELTVKTKMIVNATGPWVDELRKIGKGEVKGKRLHLTKGVHIVVPRERLPLKQSAYFDVEEDERMIFAIPRGDVTYIGTTDTSYKGNTSRPVAEKKDVTYILNATNFMFPSQNLTISDVISTWAGLRPLIHEDGKNPSELSRKDEIFYGKNGLVSIAGGKLTGYRKMAERTLDAVIKRLKKQFPNDFDQLKDCHTKNISLNGNFASEEALNKFITDRTGEAKQIQLSRLEVEQLVLKYGKDAEMIIEKAFALYPHVHDPKKRIQEAEIWYSINHEMSNNPSDYLIRRSGRLYFERMELIDIYSHVIDKMSDAFTWDAVTKDKYTKEFEYELDDVVSFKGKNKISVA